MRRDLITSVIAIVVLTVLFGLIYPFAMTGIAQVVFPGRANGSLITRNGKVVGSRLIAQDFRKPVIGKNGKPEMTAPASRCSRPIPRTSRSAPRRHAVQRRGVVVHEPRTEQRRSLATRSSRTSTRT